VLDLPVRGYWEAPLAVDGGLVQPVWWLLLGAVALAGKSALATPEVRSLSFRAFPRCPVSEVRGGLVVRTSATNAAVMLDKWR
jgi:hypothetical protein